MEFTFLILALLSWPINAAITSTTEPSSTAKLSVFSQPISIERFGALLRRVGQIRPQYQFIAQAVQPAVATAIINAPLGQPPANYPYNYYLPIYQYDNDKPLDSISEQMQEFKPPPESPKEMNYYAIKPRKHKKYSSSMKLVNLNIADGEKSKKCENCFHNSFFETMPDEQTDMLAAASENIPRLKVISLRI